MIGVITNPHAKCVVLDPMLPRRLAQIGGRQALVVSTSRPQEVAQAMHRLVESGVAVVAACGGDGTNLSVISEMVRAYDSQRLPSFAPLRGGTVNTVAANLKLEGSPEDILTRLVACHNRGMSEPVEQRDLLQVNGSSGFLFGGAMVSQLFDLYYQGSSPGVGSASWLTLRVTLASLLHTPLARRLFAPIKARITVDGAVLDNERWTLLVGSTLMNVGLGINITYRALERPGCFHLIASGLSARELARQFHRTFLARPLVGEPHYDQLAREVVIEFDRPQWYIMDGDLFQAERVVMRSGPRIRLSVP